MTNLSIGEINSLFSVKRYRSIWYKSLSGFSIQQIFRALQNDVRSVQAFKKKLLQQNSNLQFSQVNDLFKQYGY